MDKKNILISIDNIDKGEIQKYLINFLKNIDYNKFNIDLLLKKTSGYYKKNLPKKVNIITNNKKNILLNKLEKIKFNLKNHNKYNTSIIFNIDSLESNKTILKASKNKIMFVNEDYIKNFSEEQFREFFTKRNIYNFNQLIFKSTESKEKFLKYYPSLNRITTVISSVINVDKIEKDSLEKINIKFKRTDKKILFIGTLNEELNKVSNYLNMVKELKKDIPNIKLYIIGNGIDYTAYKSFIDDNNLSDHIILLDNVDNIYPYIKKVDYVIIPDEINEYKTIITEIFLLKTNIISTKILSDDLLRVDDKTGYIISSNYNQLLKDMLNILNNKDKKNKIDIEKINKTKITLLENLLTK